MKEERKHLAKVLEMLEAFPPFATLQSLLSRIIPMADPNAKPGGSLLGDLTQYCYAWHERNPGLAMTIYYTEPIPEIPILPKKQAPPQQGGPPRVLRTDQVTSEKYRSPASRRAAGVGG